MSDSALSKVHRASKHIKEVTNLFKENPPFSYVLQTNTVTFERFTKSKQNKAVIDEGCNIAGDAIHNLRAALDHAYFDIAKTIASGPRGLKSVQFPFSETRDGLETSVKNRLAHKVSDKFFNAIMELKPHGEAGGNKILYLIHQIDALDKHRFPVPTGDYKDISSNRILSEVPHYPNFLSDVHVSGCSTDVRWRAPISFSENLGEAISPSTIMFERQLKIPVKIVFKIGSHEDLWPMIPTLNAMVDETKNTIKIIREATK